MRSRFQQVRVAICVHDDEANTSTLVGAPYRKPWGCTHPRGLRPWVLGVIMVGLTPKYPRFVVKHLEAQTQKQTQTQTQAQTQTQTQSWTQHKHRQRHRHKHRHKHEDRHKHKTRLDQTRPNKSRQERTRQDTTFLSCFYHRFLSMFLPVFLSAIPTFLSVSINFLEFLSTFYLAP